MFTPCTLSLTLPALHKNEEILLGAAAPAQLILPPDALPVSDSEMLPVGTVLTQADTLKRTDVLRIEGKCLWPAQERELYIARVLEDCEAGDYKVETLREGYALAVITMSDKGFAGKRVDESGPALMEMVNNTVKLCHSQRFLLPDDPARMRALVLQLNRQGYDMIISTGGTGLSPRDLTPEALIPVLDRRVPGFEQAMMAFSLQKTPRAVLSRALTGTIGTTLIMALPGSRRAAMENLEAILPALDHALEKLAGDTSDCGRA